MIAFTETEDITNEMYGFLPRELSLLTELKRFLASQNHIEGGLDEPFHGLTLLDTLVLDNNLMSGSIPVNVLQRNPNLGSLLFSSQAELGTSAPI